MTTEPTPDTGGMPDTRLLVDDDHYPECGCGLWICHDCRPEHPIHGDIEAQERMAGARRMLTDLGFPERPSKSVAEVADIGAMILVRIPPVD